MKNTKSIYFRVLFISICFFARLADGELSQNIEVFSVNSDAELEFFDSPAQSLGKNYHLPMGSEITIVEKWPFMDLGEFAKIYIDSDLLSLPTEAWVRVADLYKVSHPIDWELDPLFLDPEDYANEDFANIDSSEFFPFATGKRRTPSCYRDVKYELLRRKLVNRYPPGAAAWQGYDVLRMQFGFTPVEFSQELPDGAVCVSEGGKYKCGKKACGHIAIKIGKAKWYGAGVFPHPLLRNHYRLRCLIKK
jgi:hypothetical protein